jgi:hypothetical protein
MERRYGHESHCGWQDTMFGSTAKLSLREPTAKQLVRAELSHHFEGCASRALDAICAPKVGTDTDLHDPVRIVRLNPFRTTVHVGDSMTILEEHVEIRPYLITRIEDVGRSPRTAAH